MIEREDGKYRSKWTDREIKDSIKNEIESLSESEKKFLVKMLREAGDAEFDRETGVSDGDLCLWNALNAVEYKTRPVDMETFLYDDYYLGEIGRTLYPCWAEDLKELFSGNYYEAVIGGAIGTGKTTMAQVAVIRMVYEISCMVDPQRSFGLEKGTDITFQNVSSVKTLAEDAIIGGIASKIDNSPYFMEKFKPDISASKIKFPGNINVIASASDMKSLLSLNTFGGILDEVNFVGQTKKRAGGDVGKMEKLYTQTIRRMKSRYNIGGKLPGILLMISSKNLKSSFTEKKIAKSLDDPNLFVREYCLTGDTKIPLLNGETLTFKELVNRYGGTDERFWVYSCDQRTKTIVPGKAYRPRVTLIDEPILEVELDNGEVVRCTTNHPFMLRDGSYKKAGELDPGDSLMPFYRKLDGKGYEEISQPGWDGRWQKTHRSGNHKVVTVRDGGRADVYDLSVEEHSNFCIEAGVVVHNSLWDVKPERYSEKKFFVFAGNSKIHSYVVDDDSNENLSLIRGNIRDNEKFEGCKLISIPFDFKKDFEDDTDSALKDIAGIAIDTISRFIYRSTTIEEAVDHSRRHPCNDIEWVSNDPLAINWNSLVKKYYTSDRHGNKDVYIAPIINPDALRHVHIDTSETKDCTGITISHVSGYKKVKRRDIEGNVYTETAPFIVVDFMLRVVPPPGDSIILADIRTIIYAFIDHGYNIAFASTDTYQSLEMRQQLEAKGVDVEVISIDKTPVPYKNLRSALYEGRLKYYNYPIVKRELLKLIYDRERQKVDHVDDESKDVADSLAGSAHSCETRMSVGAIMPGIGISEYDGDDDVEDDDWVLEKGAGKMLKDGESTDVFLPVV